MLTRLEVHGFKNLLNFSVDFGAFNCIAGLNGVGKSNILDAIRFLSFLSDHSLTEAALKVRGEGTSPTPKDIFWTNGETTIEKIKLSAEMIVDRDIVDDFGRAEKASSTFLRYEIEIGYEKNKSLGNEDRIYLASESLRYITKGEATKKVKFPHSAQRFRNSAIINSRKGAEYISTHKAHDGITEIWLHQDGGSSGQPQKIPASHAPKSVIANTNSSVWPSILAARREMQSWRFLALEPSAMRRSNRFHEARSVGSNGDQLASTLQKLCQNDPGTLTLITSRLSEIIPVKGLRVDVDEVRQLLTLEVRERSGTFLPARSLSDGTLRFLALCIMSEDPDFKGLLCFEEPENGIHPARMHAMLELLKEMTIDTYEAPSEENPMRQLIIATHSPVLVQLQSPDDLLYADIVKVKGPDGSPTSTIKCRYLENTWRSSSQENIMGRSSIISYLTYPKDAQITLDI